MEKKNTNQALKLFHLNWRHWFFGIQTKAKIDSEAL